MERAPMLVESMDVVVESLDAVVESLDAAVVEDVAVGVVVVVVLQ